MTCFALLFACGYVVDGASLECLFLSVLLAHVRVGVVFLRTLEEVAGVARVLDAVEGFERQGSLVSLQREAELIRVFQFDVLEHFGAVADEEWSRGEGLGC